MPYIIIESYPVFLDIKKYKLLNEEVCSGKDPRWILSSTIHGHKEAEEKNELMYNSLLNKFISNKIEFLKNWYCFDLKNEDAIKNVWDLLYDYSIYFGNSYLSDLRDDVDKILSDYEGHSFAYPMGQIFEFNFVINSARRGFRSLFRKNKNLLTLIIDVSKVTRLSGNLNEFKLCTEAIRIEFSKNVIVNYM